MKKSSKSAGSGHPPQYLMTSEPIQSDFYVMYVFMGLMIFFFHTTQNEYDDDDDDVDDADIG